MEKSLAAYTRLPVAIATLQIACFIAMTCIQYTVRSGSTSDGSLMFWINIPLYISSFTTPLLLFFGPYYFAMYRKDSSFMKILVGFALFTSITYYLIRA